MKFNETTKWIIATSIALIGVIAAILTYINDLQIKHDANHTEGDQSQIINYNDERNGNSNVTLIGNQENNNYINNLEESIISNEADVLITGGIAERSAECIESVDGAEIINLNKDSLNYGSNWLPQALNAPELYPCYDINFLNRGRYSLDIRNVYVEVTQYYSPNEYKVIEHAGGADSRDIIYWDCEIEPKTGHYIAILSDENPDKKYFQVKSAESGVFYIRMFPSTEGIYYVKVIFEYQYNGQTLQSESETRCFVYEEFEY